MPPKTKQKTPTAVAAQRINIPYVNANTVATDIPIPGRLANTVAPYPSTGKEIEPLVTELPAAKPAARSKPKAYEKVGAKALDRLDSNLYGDEYPLLATPDTFNRPFSGIPLMPDPELKKYGPDREAPYSGVPLESMPELPKFMTENEKKTITDAASRAATSESPEDASKASSDLIEQAANAADVPATDANVAEAKDILADEDKSGDLRGKNPDEMTMGEKLALALMPALTALAGYALGGRTGALIGGAAGFEGMGQSAKGLQEILLAKLKKNGIGGKPFSYVGSDGKTYLGVLDSSGNARALTDEKGNKIQSAQISEMDKIIALRQKDVDLEMARQSGKIQLETLKGDISLEKESLKSENQKELQAQKDKAEKELQDRKAEAEKEISRQKAESVKEIETLRSRAKNPLGIAALNAEADLEKAKVQAQRDIEKAKLENEQKLNSAKSQKEIEKIKADNAASVKKIEAENRAKIAALEAKAKMARMNEKSAAAKGMTEDNLPSGVKTWDELKVLNYGYAITKKDRDDLIDADIKLKDFIGEASKLIELRKAHGFQPIGNANVAAESSTQRLILMGKELENLGVLNGNDHVILEDAIGSNPLNVMWKGFGKGDKATIALEGYVDKAKRGFVNKLKAKIRGASESPATPAVKSQAPTTPKPTASNQTNRAKSAPFKLKPGKYPSGYIFLRDGKKYVVINGNGDVNEVD